MPPHMHNSDAKSSDLSNEQHKERVPIAPHRQMLVGVETPSHYDSNSNNDNGDEMHYNINTISKLNPKVLKGMLIELTKHNKVRNYNAYKKPSHRSDFHQRLSCIHDTLKEVPKCHRVCAEDPAQETLNKHWVCRVHRMRNGLAVWFSFGKAPAPAPRPICFLSCLCSSPSYSLPPS
ncbi:uncharacterized protein UBRO_07464 [Ustilago bromivora]|uniref:Uncharacterized protein n=1 Tax=Ustilago bromivora TaxID=307758 RepID=A0A1K0HAG4_9BASI|nr:uncharacterized protein UBRO_07464 [Ustilago bromivora]